MLDDFPAHVQPNTQDVRTMILSQDEGESDHLQVFNVFPSCNNKPCSLRPQWYFGLQMVGLEGVITTGSERFASPIDSSERDLHKHLPPRSPFRTFSHSQPSGIGYQSNPKLQIHTWLSGFVRWFVDCIYRHLIVRRRRHRLLHDMGNVPEAVANCGGHQLSVRCRYSHFLGAVPQKCQCLHKAQLMPTEHGVF